MATQSRRRKQATYGKISRTANTWNSTSLNLDAMDEDELSISVPTISRTARVTQSYSVQKRGTKPNEPTPKPAKRREIKQDVWDVPSSESSEDEPSPARRPAPRFGGKGKSDKVEETEKLAPWERPKTTVSSPARQSYLRATNIEASRSVEWGKRTSGDHPGLPLTSPSAAAKIVKEKAVSPLPVRSSPNPSSAAARLQARRLQSGRGVLVPSQKRVVHQGGNAGTRPRKRLRADLTLDDDDDVRMEDASTPSCDSAEKDKVPENIVPSDPGCSDDGTEDVANATPEAMKPKAAAIQRARRGKITTYSSPRKMESAPARLSEMLPEETNTSDDTRSPSNMGSRPTTPQASGSAAHISSPETAIRTTARTKQSQLLTRLLPDEAVVASPSMLPMQALKIASARRDGGGKAMTSRTLLKSSSDVGPPRTRLVDRLKASALSSDEDSSGADVTDASDVEMSNAEDREVAISQQSQSQSQMNAAGSRPKVTYAATERSWLKEESFEEELMLDVPTETPRRTVTSPHRTFNKSNSASQKSAFDFDDSDGDEGAAGRLRTIHELRAGGINQRFMDDISGLLEDAANHNISARSRRRSALIEIATKLADKAFAAKFYRQGFEQQLTAECTAAPDDIADFALATALAVLLTGDTPEHFAQSLRDGGALSLLFRTLTSRSDPRMLAKERRNNMSKGAQSDFARFVTYVGEQRSIWDELELPLVTSRTIALKALDLLVSKLRRSGDRSELVNHLQLLELLPSQAEIDASRDGDVPADMMLSVSVLESISTTAVSLDWPGELTECLRMILTSPIEVNANSQHLRFLTLRLCLNLTNDNVKNCKAIAKPDTVVALLKSMAAGFEALFHDQEDSQRTINLDLLVLSMGIMINLTEQKCGACEHAAAAEDAAPVLATLVDVFLQGQQRTLEAESVEDGVTNVAFGYLAVVLANLCRSRDARLMIACRLPGKKLTALVAAVQEFVLHHQKVDTLNFDGAEGIEVWSAFTEKLKGVLSRLEAEAEVDEIDSRQWD